MKTKAVIAHFGTVKELAYRLEVSESSVYMWIRKPLVPESKVIQVHLLSDCKIPIDPEDYRRRSARE